MYSITQNIQKRGNASLVTEWLFLGYERLGKACKMGEVECIISYKLLKRKRQEESLILHPLKVILIKCIR